MKKKTILFRGERTADGVLIYGFYQEISFDGVLYPYIFWQGESHPVIPESVAQYHHTTAKGEQVFLPIYYEETTGIVSKLTQLNLGDSVEIKSDSFPVIRVQCSVINKSLRPQGLRLRTSGNKELGVVTVFCERC